MPGNIPTAPMARQRVTKPTTGTTTRPIKPNSALRALQPMRPRLSSSMVSDQPKTGLTSADKKTTMAADWVVLPLRVISMPASSSGTYTPTISATLNTGFHIAKSIG